MDRDFSSNNSFSLLSEVSQVKNIFTFHTASASSVVNYLRTVTHLLPREVALVSAKQIFVLDNISPVNVSSEKFALANTGFKNMFTKGVEQIQKLAFLTSVKKYDNRISLFGNTGRNIYLIGDHLSLFSYKGKNLSSLVIHAFSEKGFSVFGDSYSQFADKESGIASKIPRIAEAKLLPIYAVSNNKVNDNEGIVLGAFTSNLDAKTLTKSSNKNNLPALDQLSLSLYCGFSSLSTTVDGSRCNYNSLASGLVSSKLAVSTPEITNKVSDVKVPSTDDIFPPLTPKFTGSNGPTYINQYITKYVGVPGPKGSDGKSGANGTDGKNGRDGISPTLIGNFIVPPSNSYSQNLIPVSTIGYLKDTTIEYAIIKYGTATNLNIGNSTIADAVFNGSNTFNGTTTFAGSFNINDINSGNSNFINSTTTNAYISNLHVGTSTTSGLATFENNVNVAGLINAGSLTVTGTTTLRGALVVDGTLALSTTTITNANISELIVGNSTTTNGFFANLVAALANINNLNVNNSSTTNAYIENLTVGTSTIVTLNNLTGTTSSFINSSSTNLITTNGVITNLEVTNSSTTNATTTNGFFSNLVATIAN
ncbi:MAG: hypothetical protein WCK60_03305, partial [Candidatus Nomurabacteria bacterium]